MIGIARRRIPLLNDDGRIDGYEYVDLGLPSGLKWATCNVGASVETDYGNYYQFGAGATQYANTNQYYTGKSRPFPAAYDTATQVMGGGWRMPTAQELSDLRYKTDIIFISDFNGSGVAGVKFMNKKDNSIYIFVPCAGIYKSGSLLYLNSTLCLWSSERYYSSYSYGEGLAIQNRGSGSSIIDLVTVDRKNGCSVRGVHA